MALIAMADNNIDIPAYRDGAFYNVLANGQDFVISGIGGELNVATSAGSFVATLATGIGVVNGRTVEATAPETLTLSANQSGYIALRVDLSQVAGYELSLIATPSLVQEDLNNGGYVHDLALCQFTTGANGVTSAVDVRNMLSSAASMGFVTYQVTLASANWSGSQQTITVPANIMAQLNYDADIYVEISLPETATRSVRDACARAVIGTSTTLAGNGALNIVFTYAGTQPTVDIPVLINIEGKEVNHEQ